MASDVDVYVDPDAVGGGTGVDWVNAYTSLQIAQNTRAKDISLGTGSDERFVFHVRSSGGTADTTQVQWSNTWVCDYSNGNYLLVTPASGHEVIKSGWDSSRYRLSITDGLALYLLEYGSGAHAIVYDGIHCERVYSSSQYQPCIRVNACAAGTVVILKNCRIRTNESTLNAVYISDADCTLRMWNCIIEGSINNGLYVTYGTHYAWNCVIRGSGAGIGVNVGSSGTLTIENCAVFNFNDDFSISGTATIDHCASDDGDGTNPVSPSGSDWDNEYNDPTNGDYTLLNTGNCYHGGVDNPSSGLYTTDIEGDAYNSGAYSIGVDEYSAGGPVSVLISETLAVSDILAEATNRGLVVADSTGLNSSAVEESIRGLVLSEGIDFGDVDNDSSNRSLLLFEDISLDELLNLLSSHLNTVSEILALSDFAGTAAESQKTVTESLSLSEASSLLSNRSLVCIDSISFDEVNGFVMKITVTCGEFLHLSDLISYLKTKTIVISEGMSLNDLTELALEATDEISILLPSNGGIISMKLRKLDT